MRKLLAVLFIALFMLGAGVMVGCEVEEDMNGFDEELEQDL